MQAPLSIPGDDSAFFYLMDEGGSEKWQIYKYTIKPTNDNIAFSKWSYKNLKVLGAKHASIRPRL